MDPSNEPAVPATPRHRDTSFDTIYRELRRRISLLIHRPGAVLSENKLAAEFGVSRTPIRRVLQALEFEGLVEISPGVGTLVTTLDLRYLKQVYALRMRLIDLTGEHPVPALAEIDRARLVALRERALALRNEPDPTALAEVYHEFHETLLRLIGNRPLREISDRYFVQTSRMWLQLLPEMDWDTEVSAVIDELEGVTEALEQRDTRRVTDVRRRHFRAVLQRMNAVLAGDDLDVLPREGVMRP